ncbi:hypothetical protein LWI28_012218 [Acer negundo]|uniref:Uncharacterized protein n=1 Tax=Acer negundo TaxID=4023 RepID=A0AAD5NN80_ACENE|nr:hypothetical protein LWI28_012218 [Acer negundo]
MSISNSVKSLSKALEDEKIVSRLAIAEKDVVSTRLRKEKQTRIAAEVERDDLRSMRVVAKVENDAALKRDALRGRLPLEWIDGYRKAMIDIGVPPLDWDSFSY